MVELEVGRRLVPLKEQDTGFSEGLEVERALSVVHGPVLMWSYRGNVVELRRGSGITREVACVCGR